MAAGVEAPRAGGFISSELNGTGSRDQVGIIALNDGLTTYPAGTVLGQQTAGSVAAFANVAGGTGNGTSGAIVVGPGALQGVYTGQCIVAGATAKFLMETPVGINLPEMTVGTAYNQGGLAFTITTGGASYVVGDQITITVGTAVSAPGGGNVGNGTVSAVATSAGVRKGAYVLVATGALAFSVTDPTGLALPALAVGTQYTAGGLTFTITAGGTPFAAGDTFTITTSSGNGNFAPVNAAAGDGTEYAAGVLMFPTYVGGSAVQQATILNRMCELKAGNIVWPAGATQDQILVWTSQLLALGVKLIRSLV